MNRKPLEKYYTPKDIAMRLTKQVLDRYGKDNLFVEPSAGKGVFVDCLLELGIPDSNIKRFDILPHTDRKDIIQADFLSMKEYFQDAVCIGNPPFGRVGRLAIKFLNVAYEKGAKAICFMLPGTIWHRRFTSTDISLHLDLISYEQLGSINFENEFGESIFNTDSIIQIQFQIYESLFYAREPFHIPFETDDFIITSSGHYNKSWEPFKATKISHFGLISFGCDAGKVRSLLGDTTFLMGIKVKDRTKIEQVASILNSIDYSHYYVNDTFTDKHAVYPDEVVTEYNKIIQRR